MRRFLLGLFASALATTSAHPQAQPSPFVFKSEYEARAALEDASIFCRDRFRAEGNVEAERACVQAFYDKRLETKGELREIGAALYGVAPSTAPDAPRPVGGCAENGSCYGDISAATGRPKTVGVRGYYRKDGTYVRGHYRSKPK